jgi:tellurite resistance protein TerC
MGSLLRWIIFNAFILLALFLDLRVVNHKPHKTSMREAAFWSCIWIAISILFGIGVNFYMGEAAALEYFTGYLIEKALSVDNLFLFLLIFRAFAVDERVQHRLLEWGVIGALLMRGAMIAAGAALIERFSWVLYVLGAFLVYAGIHLLFVKKEKIHPEQNAIFRFAQKHLRITRDYQGQRFFVRNGGQLFATPLFVVLLVVEVTDITLAIDSIPAIFGITRDPFIVYTSNVFAILGLRALYFLLAGALSRMRFLTVGLSFILVFIGGKMLAEKWWHVPVYVSLTVVALMLLISVGASWLLPAKAKPATAKMRPEP